MTAHEKHIRDFLAAHLEMIEPGLRTVRTEYHVPNSNGARGFVDILARDKGDMWVVIELKRSGETARQALHEVAKYTELLRREKGIPKDQIRAIIVSTTWHDLLTPASNLARDWDYDLRGYAISAGADGAVLQIEPVDFLPEPFDLRPTRVQLVGFYRSEQDRELGWGRLVTLAAQARAHHLVGFDFDRVAAHDRVVCGFALYYAIGRIIPELAELQKELDVVPGEGDEDNPYFDVPNEYQGCPAEYRASHHIHRHGIGSVEVEQGSPDKFSALLEDHLWELRQIRRTGIYATSDAWEDRDLCNAVSGKGNSAGNRSQVRYSGSADPRIRPRWASFTDEVLEALSGNEDWSALMRCWFAEVAADSSHTNVRVGVYNPCDLVQTLLWGSTNPSLPFEFYTPGITALVGDTERFFQGDMRGIQRSTLGILAWDGRYRPDVRRLVRFVFSDPLHYWVYRQSGEVWTVDPTLLGLLGLRHVLVDMSTGTGRPQVTGMYVMEEGRLVHVPGPHCDSPFVRPDGMPYQLGDFVEAHRYEIHALVNEYLEYVQLP
ncbi:MULTISPECIES: endonuclease NucS domain-containing protein [unclassified Nocardiopsis]|uniref:endonuclease NucS domain-containing protein n=1 Tax=Nocardiopsis TaxID=2013 RepID=UPI00387B3F83